MYLSASRLSLAGVIPHQSPRGLRAVSDRFGRDRGPALPARPERRAYLVQAEAAREATSTVTPGPMEELSATFFT